jgi:zinc protease
MRFTTFLFLVGLAMLQTSPLAALTEAARFPFETTTLKNGLEVVVIPDRRAPVVTHMIWYRIGSADDPRGQSGVAHFLEHLMFKGTKAHPEGEFQAAVSSVGGRENAFTSYDYTAYFQRVAREHLGTVMAFEADRMRGLSFDDKVTSAERDVVLEERRMRIDSDPSAQLMEAMSAALFQNHPYGIPIIGWEEEIKTLNRANAFDVYKRAYAPNNAVLVIAGDVSLAEIKPLVEKTYGKVARDKSVQPRQRPLEPEPRAERRVVLQDGRVKQPILSRWYMAPAYNKLKPGEAIALDVAAHILGGGATSLLHRKLVLEAKIASSVYAYYDGSGLDMGRFALQLVPLEGVSLEQAEKALDQALADIMAKPFENQDLERAQSRLMADIIYARDSQYMLSRAVGVSRIAGLPLEDLQLEPQRLAQVQTDDLSKALASALIKRRSVTGYLMPESPSPTPTPLKH